MDSSADCTSPAFLKKSFRSMPATDDAPVSTTMPFWAKEITTLYE